MQTEAAQKFGFTPKRTMSVAQNLYEGIELGKKGK
jgi:DNA topoisomerase-1